MKNSARVMELEVWNVIPVIIQNAHRFSGDGETAVRRAFLLAASLLVLTGCGGDKNTKPRGDTAPPSAVSDLAATALGPSSVQLTWTAPGDDGNSGTASQYEIRYSSVRLEGNAWNTATRPSHFPIPQVAGARESLTLRSVSGADAIYLALRAADEVPNWSRWSNVASGQLDGAAPGAVTDLAVASLADSSITLCWTATGDDGQTGQASRYDLRSTVVHDFGWEDMTPATGLPRPAGQRDTFTVNHLVPYTEYFLSLKIGDEIPNWSEACPKIRVVTGVAPAMVTDLRVSRGTYSSLSLAWTATGNDSTRGRATRYILKVTRQADATWDQMSTVTGTPVPSPSGRTDSMTVTSLWPENDYYFRIEAGDDARFHSKPSASAHGRTASRALPDSVDLTPFIELARRALCADIRNRLFLIDRNLVFWDRASICSDGKFAEVLYGGLTDYVLCDYVDSLGGMGRVYHVPRYQEMFDTILNNLDQPDLGLGTSHVVQQIPF